MAAYNKRGRVTRVDNNFSLDLENVIIERIKRGLDKPKDINSRELTRMMRNWEHYPTLIETLKSRPRRKKK